MEPLKVTAYNAVVGNTEGPLGGDSSLRSLQARLLNDATYSITGNSGLVNLASLGINLNNDGTLTIDNTQLNNTFTANPGAFQSFFQNASATGFANNFSSDLTKLTDPVQGIVNLDIAGNKTQQQALTTQISNLQDRLATQKAALTLQYAQVNATLEAYPSLLQEVTAEIGALNGSTLSTPFNSSNSTPTSGTATG